LEVDTFTIGDNRYFLESPSRARLCESTNVQLKNTLRKTGR